MYSVFPIVLYAVTGGTAVLQLMEWMHLHFVQVDSWVAEAGSSEDPENSLQYWNAVSGALYVAVASVW